MHKLDTFTDPHRAAQQKVRKLIWNYYADLKKYRVNPSKSRRLALRARFDRIFRRRTGFVTLDRLLARLHANKTELLMVLERPEIPLHTNGSENDKHGIAFWDYLGSRLSVPDEALIPPLSELVRCRGQPA